MEQPIIKNLGLQPYLAIYELMHQFTQTRNIDTPDEIWFVQHPAVFTQGKVGKPEHLLHHTLIPVIQTDRGGQITYHAPGQQIMYILIDLRRLKLTARNIVSCLENSVVKTLANYNIIANAKIDAPGVYVDDKKICSLGLHINKGCTLHGLALNVDMDLSPFNTINPCGYHGLQMTQIKDYVMEINDDDIRKLLAQYFIEQLPLNL